MKSRTAPSKLTDVAVIIGAAVGVVVAIVFFYAPRFWIAAHILSDAGLSDFWAVALTGIVYGGCAFGIVRGVRRDDPGWPGILFFAAIGYPLILFISSVIGSTFGVPLIGGFGILVGGFVFMFVCMAIGAKIKSFRA